MIYELDDYYFLMEPWQAVLSHFPREPDADWQLLAPEQRASLANFEHWPLVKSQFYKCGMDLLNQTAGTIEAKQGTYERGGLCAFLFPIILVSISFHCTSSLLSIISDEFLFSSI